MNTLSYLVISLGASRRRLLNAAHRLGYHRTGRDYVFTDEQVAAILHEMAIGRGHPSLYEMARRRLHRIFRTDRDAVTLLLNASESCRGELKWLFEGSEEAIRDRLNTIKKIQEEK